MATAVGLNEELDRPVVETLAEQLRDKDVLLVLDNCEQVLDGALDLVQTLLGALPGLRVLATSREALGLAGEISWRVPSLDEPAAVALFIERARQARRGFSADEAQLEVLGRICRRVDGLPLAIELAAARRG